MAVLGVATFVASYPADWLGTAPALAIGTTVLYAAGTLVTFWCLFVGVATVKRRNDPGGTARLEITDEGTVRVVTDDAVGLPGLGGVGLFGSEPAGDVETQTNRAPGRADGASASAPSQEAEAARGSASPDEGATTPAGDGAGGVEAEETPAAASADIGAAVRERGRPDRYCGNCSHFEYVRANGEIAPYCGLHGELLSDMDACDQWESNS
jgi:hypothetical protein